VSNTTRAQPAVSKRPRRFNRLAAKIVPTSRHEKRNVARHPALIGTAGRSAAGVSYRPSRRRPAWNCSTVMTPTA
jgi:hypothetical protein